MYVEKMSERLEIDDKVKEKSTDFYYSASDMYGVDVFTDSFREQDILIDTQKQDKLSKITSEMFVKDTCLDVSYAFSEQMFMTRQYERKYKSDVNDMGILLEVLGGILAGTVSLIMCMILTTITKRKNRNDNNNKIKQ